MLNLPVKVYAQGFSFRKRAIVRRFMPAVEVYFVSRGSAVPIGATLLLWGSAAVPDGLPAGVNIIRLEDGFLRSVGLGADLVQPISWVMDRRGIYYDATRPSDLEHLLETQEMDAALLQRAAALRERIVTSGLTKYNVGVNAAWQRPASAQQVILVPGQVESDASIRFGAPDIQNNLNLLRAVRVANPSAYLLYKPHPDVVAGLRKQGVNEGEAAQWCDEIVADGVMGDLLSKVDEVHTLTSLAGFEALLRGRQVVCYGQPFYAGWGLTTDMVAMPRRTRRRMLDELVAAALILYPAYVSLNTGKTTTPECALDELLVWRDRAGSSVSVWRQLLRVLLRLRAD